ncbi:amino acid adenylation domain-containing protein [Nocardia transvalensis]|uniref:amino acid adenylation domain-containing protein n=1 Tax=Nocardia transvalensis TaxID=37333 RepID=UPI0018942D6E|nr:amino acid adenylation domain-containing protein [Nocardia transvalensis]MBF6329825.1 amino acid adenylation domain-containing protein [Nocardia transvalensis]
MSSDTLTRPAPGIADAIPYPRDLSLHEVFDNQAALRPRASAAVDHGRSLTYGELALRSDVLAARLIDAGVRPGDTVGVCGGRSLEAVVAFLGILKAGAAYVPLDDSAPPRRLQAMAEEAGLQTVVTLPGNICRVRRIRTRIELDATWDATVTEFQRPPVAATDCAYVIFTSGTSGRPKPVAIPHRGVVRLAFSDLVSQRPRPGDRVLHAYGLSSDASTIEIWSALLSGACLVLADREELLAPEALQDRLVADRVTIAYLTTGVFHHVARTRPEALRTLRFVSAGGEALDPDLTRAVLAACPDTTVVNFYGPTENSVVSTAHLVWNLPAEATTVPIGRPLENSTCYVVRADGTPADIGEEGDLLVGGDGLALGYLGDPELTRERFTVTADGDRRYRTGDRAVWLPSGELEYRARADRQIKLRGHRVELDEIEARLRAYDEIGEAMVDLDQNTLTGYLTPARPGQPIPIERIRRDLATWLPAAVVPSRLIPLDAFPVTHGGKVDRRRLRNLRTADAPAPTSHDGGGLLDTLAGIWQTMLRVHPAPDDDFYDLGGDSLLAAETVTRTLAALDIEARHSSALIHSLLSTPTLQGYADAVTGIHTRTASTPEVDFAAEGRLGFIVPAERGPAPDWRQPREVLVTGASGFVGAFLIDRLLRTTTARIHCPVRARDTVTAYNRVHSALARFNLAPPDLGRLVCFPADLTKPGLGLDPARAATLTDTLDLVFHSAAQVNFLYPYTALKAANVEGTREIVRLAAPRRVPVHFLSTIAVLAGFGTAGIHHVTEDRPLAHPDRLTMGYAESKWVAEQVLRDAAAQGVPVAVYRPYEITGDQRTGACNTETAICSLFKTISETGLAPDIPLPMDFVPVDYLADAIIHIATHRATTDSTYHLTNPRPATFADMLERMKVAGHPITMLPYNDWVAELVRHVTANPTSATAPFVSLCVDRSNKADISVKEMYFEGTFPTLDRTNVEHDLAGSGLVCPPVDTALLDRYLEYFHVTGYINRPNPKDLQS